jgi:hypothetical protein
MVLRNSSESKPAEARPHAGGRRWLLFAHQLPSHPSNLRVRTWRRLQQLGAMPLKQAVYVLPDTPQGREDCEWLKAEVKAMGGDAAVFTADHVDAWSDDALVEEFRRARQEAYADLAGAVDEALQRATRARRPRGARAPAVERLLAIFRERLAAIDGIDFFGSAGRDRVLALLAQLGERSRAGRTPAASPPRQQNGPGSAYDGRLWITRPRPGVDRMASAWLIRRFIDPRARFGFAADRESVPKSGVPFDMFGVEFTHHGGNCTFETLCSVFDLRGPALSRLAAIVHDLDLKDERFGAAEAPTVGALIDGLQLAHAGDDELLAQGMTLFDSLHRSFEQSMRAAGPRPLAGSVTRRRPRAEPRPTRRR